MMTLLFVILLLAVVGKLAWFAIGVAWGIAKVLLTCVLFPIVLIALVVGGLVYLALPILIIVGLVMLLKPLFT